MKQPYHKSVRQHDDSDQRNNGGDATKSGIKTPGDLDDQQKKSNVLPTLKSQGLGQNLQNDNRLQPSRRSTNQQEHVYEPQAFSGKSLRNMPRRANTRQAALNSGTGPSGFTKIDTLLGNADRGLRSQMISDDPLLSSLTIEINKNQTQHDLSIKDQLFKNKDIMSKNDSTIENKQINTRRQKQNDLRLAHEMQKQELMIGSGGQKASGKIYPNLSIDNKGKLKGSKQAGENPSGRDNLIASNKIRSKKLSKENSKVEDSNSWMANGKPNDSAGGKQHNAKSKQMKKTQSQKVGDKRKAISEKFKNIVSSKNDKTDTFRGHKGKAEESKQEKKDNDDSSLAAKTKQKRGKSIEENDEGAKKRNKKADLKKKKQNDSIEESRPKTRKGKMIQQIESPKEQSSYNEESLSINESISKLNKDESSQNQSQPIEKFEDEKFELGFKNFLRILKFKHKKNIVVQQVGNEFDNHFQNQLIELYNAQQLHQQQQQALATHNMSNEQMLNNLSAQNSDEQMASFLSQSVMKDWQGQNQIMSGQDEYMNQLGEQEQQQQLQYMQEQQQHLEGQINDILIDLQIENTSPQDIDATMINQIRSFEFPEEQTLKVNRLLHLVIEFQQLQMNLQAYQNYLNQPNEQQQEGENGNGQVDQGNASGIFNNKAQPMEVDNQQEEQKDPQMADDDQLDLNIQMNNQQNTLQQYRECKEVLAQHELALNHQDIIQTLQSQNPEKLLEINAQYEGAKQIIKDFDQQYQNAYLSIIKYVLNQFENPEQIFDGLNTDQDGKALPSKPQKIEDKESITKSPKIEKEEEPMIKQLNLSDEELEQIAQVNGFFIDLYRLINQIITPEGQTPKKFNELLQKQFPQTLQDFSVHLEQLQSPNYENEEMDNNQMLDQIYQSEQERVILEQIMQYNNENENDPIDLNSYNLYQNMDENNQLQFQNSETLHIEAQQRNNQDIINQILAQHGLQFEQLLNIDAQETLKILENLSEDKQVLLKKAILQMDSSVFDEQNKENIVKLDDDNEQINEEQFEEQFTHQQLQEMMQNGQFVYDDQEGIQQQLNQGIVFENQNETEQDGSIKEQLFQSRNCVKHATIAMVIKSYREAQQNNEQLQQAIEKYHTDSQQLDTQQQFITQAHISNFTQQQQQNEEEMNLQQQQIHLLEAQAQGVELPNDDITGENAQELEQQIHPSNTDLKQQIEMDQNQRQLTQAIQNNIQSIPPTLSRHKTDPPQQNPLMNLIDPGQSGIFKFNNNQHLQQHLRIEQSSQRRRDERQNNSQKRISEGGTQWKQKKQNKMPFELIHDKKVSNQHQQNQQSSNKGLKGINANTSSSGLQIIQPECSQQKKQDNE